jgi:cell shape-determining protein MreC
MKKILPLLLLVSLSGCVVNTAAHIVTAPVRAGAKVVDWTTTSQDEADRNRGRRDRKEEKKQRKAEREAREQQPN